MRLHIPRRRRDARYFAKLRDELSKCEGVERVEANPTTASVLIQHRSTREKLAHFAEAAQLFVVALEDAPLSSRSMATQVNTRVGNLNERIAAATNGNLDLTTISALGLGIGGIIKGLATKKFLPNGADMIWWAITLLARHDNRMRVDAMAGSSESNAEASPRRARRSRH